MALRKRKPASFSKTQVARALPRPGDPLVLEDGTVLQEEKPDVSALIEAGDIGLTVSARDFRPNVKRVIKDFPANDQMLRAIAVVFGYTLYGISNSEICESLGIDLVQLDEIRSHQGYSDLFNSILSEFISANSDLLQSRIAAYSRTAVNRVGHLVSNAKKEEVQLKASQDILDRAGMRPQDIQANNQASLDELQIRITKKTDDVIVDVKLGGNNGKVGKQGVRIEIPDEDLSQSGAGSDREGQDDEGWGHG